MPHFKFSKESEDMCLLCIHILGEYDKNVQKTDASDTNFDKVIGFAFRLVVSLVLNLSKLFETKSCFLYVYIIFNTFF